jgi:uncharacterized protein (DUF58 family)
VNAGPANPKPPTGPAANVPVGRFLSAPTLMAIRSLELRARAVVEGFWSGLHRSPYHGFSVEFTEYRQYTPGDDPRHLDWRVFARSDRYVIKKFEDETNLRCHLVLDRSRSLEFGTQGYTKAEYAGTLAATLGHFLHLPARNRPGQLRHLMQLLETPAAGKATELSGPLERTAEIVRKRGLIVLISDFLAPLEVLEQPLTRLAAAGHELVAFQVLDPAERDFKFSQASYFEDVESGRTLYIDPAVARASYLERFQAHQEALRATCNRLGVAWQPLVTDQPLELALHDFLQARARRGRIVRRAGGSGGGRR